VEHRLDRYFYSFSLDGIFFQPFLNARFCYISNAAFCCHIQVMKEGSSCNWSENGQEQEQELAQK
jgi:hypothetical protein